VAPLQVSGNLAFNGTVNVRISGNVTTVGTYPLIKYGSFSGTPPTIPASLPVGLVASLVNNTANKTIDLQVTVGNVLTWAFGNGAWDIGTTANWKDPGSAIVTYADGRAVQLDDTASGTSPIAITLDTVVNPAMITVAAATKDYSISGSGSIAGFAGLAKKGPAKLTLSGTHTYSSGTLVSEGTLQLGDGTANNGFIAGGIVSDATLIFANPLDQINAVAISGTGAVVKAGSGMLTFSTRQTYSGGTIVNSGILDLTAGGGAIGTIRGTATVNTGGTLRLSTGDAIGYGTTDRVNPLNLNGGTLDVNIVSAGGGNQTLGNATINMTGGAITGLPDGNIDFFQGGSALNTFASATPSTISGVAISPLRQGSTTFTVEDGAAAIDLDITSVIRTSPSGDAAGAVLIKAGAGTMRLGADNTFARGVQIDAGTVQVDGSLAVGADVVVNSGGTLDGTGTINGNVTVNSGGTLSPGTNGIGVLFTYGTVTLGTGSTTAVDVDVTSLTCDLVQGSASVTFGGNLVVTNHSGTPTIGQNFQIFTPPGTGNFSSITPPPGTGLAWKFDPTTGYLSVVQGPPTTPTNITAVVVGPNLEVSWPSEYVGWQLQVQINPINVGLSDNWSAWEGSTMTNRVFVPILQSNPSVFLRLTYPPLP
jgi:autotransporter-associated beta strand protein